MNNLLLTKVINERQLAGNFKIDTELLEYYCTKYGNYSGLTNREKDFAKKMAALTFLKYKNNYLPASSIPEGFVYVISNPAWPTSCKIGKAICPKDRLKQFQTGSPLRDFKIEHYIFSENALETESWLHNVFKKHRLEGEWFNIHPIKVVESLRAYSSNG